MDFKEMRKLKGWSQAKAAREMKVSLTTWSRWEWESMKPNEDNMKKIKEVFDIKEK